MKNQRWIVTFLGAALTLAPGCIVAQSQTDQGPPAQQDMHHAGRDIQNAGRDTGHAARDTGRAAGKETKKGWHKTKRGTKKAWHKTKNTTKGAVRGGEEGAHQPQ